MKIEIRPDVPDEVVQTVVPLLHKYKLLFPLWMQRCVVNWRQMEDYTMQIHVQDDYRQCFIDVSAFWFECDADTKEDCVIHEIVHSFRS